MFVLVYGLVRGLLNCVCNILEWSCITSSCVRCIRISCTIRVVVFIVAICSWNKNVRIWVDIQLVNMSTKCNKVKFGTVHRGGSSPKFDWF